MRGERRARVLAAMKWEHGVWVWVLVYVALFFNPVYPLHLGRTVWFFVDLGTIVLFVMSASRFSRLAREADTEHPGI
jgi:hypothetical protein